MAAIAANPWIDPARLGIGGWSYGGILTNYASDYLTRHPRVTQSFEPDDATLDDFRNFLHRSSILAPDEFWNKDKDYLKVHIKAEAFTLVFGLKSGNEVQMMGDPQVKKAAALLTETSEILKPASGKIARPPTEITPRSFLTSTTNPMTSRGTFG